jgi:hypothetical protein
MDEVVVAAADAEVEAEIIAGRLRAEHIPVRVRYDSQPVPSGLGYGLGAFRVAVPAEHAAAASDLLADVGERPASRSRLFRAVAIIVLVSFLLVWVPGVIGTLQALFGPPR